MVCIYAPKAHASKATALHSLRGMWARNGVCASPWCVATLPRLLKRRFCCLASRQPSPAAVLPRMPPGSRKLQHTAHRETHSHKWNRRLLSRMLISEQLAQQTCCIFTAPREGVRRMPFLMKNVFSLMSRFLGGTF